MNLKSALFICLAGFTLASPVAEAACAGPYCGSDVSADSIFDCGEIKAAGHSTLEVQICKQTLAWAAQVAVSEATAKQSYLPVCNIAENTAREQAQAKCEALAADAGAPKSDCLELVTFVTNNNSRYFPSNDPAALPGSCSAKSVFVRRSQN